MKFRGVISLRKLLPIWPIPNGTRTREVSTTFLKLTKIPWAVSGRRKARSSSFPATAPIRVSNIRLNSRGSVSVPGAAASGPSTSASVTVPAVIDPASDSNPPIHSISSTCLARSPKNFCALAAMLGGASSPDWSVVTNTFLSR